MRSTRSTFSAPSDALDSALIHGLDSARRLGWNDARKLYQLGQLYRAYYVSEAERRSGEHEPDEFHKGIAPCVKLLHFVVDRLTKRRVSASQRIVARWALTPSPLHARLWAALARDPWIASGDEVNNFLDRLDDHQFWDAQNFPEIAELRAVRFRDLSPTMQLVLTTRLQKLPPRNEWPRGTDPVRLARARLYWSLREMGRIKVAGGVLPPQNERWFASEIANFPELAQMTRLDDGFMGTPAATTITPNPDMRYDVLAGEERLSALELALGTASRGWDSDASQQAWDWMRQTGNAAKLITDLEASADGGAAFPIVWERFGWAQSSGPEINKLRPQRIDCGNQTCPGIARQST